MFGLFCKPASSHIYPRRRSDYPYLTIKSNPKSQFLRIRWICTDIKDYWKQANHGHHESQLRQIANEAAERKENHKFSPDQRTEEYNQNSNRIPLVLIWHWNFAGISKVLHDNYKTYFCQNISVLRFFPNRLSFLSKEIKKKSEKL